MSGLIKKYNKKIVSPKFQHILLLIQRLNNRTVWTSVEQDLSIKLYYVNPEDGNKIC